MYGGVGTIGDRWDLTAIRQLVIYPGLGSIGAIAGSVVLELQQMLAASGYDVGPLDGIMGTRTATALQRFLAAAGFDPGPVDGVYGARTEAALHAYQTAHGQSPTPLLPPRPTAVPTTTGARVASGAGVNWWLVGGAGAAGLAAFGLIMLLTPSRA
ncbi:MAG: peptidoglycan-binding domain-containing protein [Candidatus Rokuibacteriota bacterium]